MPVQNPKHIETLTTLEWKRIAPKRSDGQTGQSQRGRQLAGRSAGEEFPFLRSHSMHFGFQPYPPKPPLPAKTRPSFRPSSIFVVRSEYLEFKAFEFKVSHLRNSDTWFLVIAILRGFCQTEAHLCTHPVPVHNAFDSMVSVLQISF